MLEYLGGYVLMFVTDFEMHQKIRKKEKHKGPKATLQSGEVPTRSVSKKSDELLQWSK